jgi:acetyltransferase
VRVIQHVGGLLHECPEIREIDINPLRVHPEGQGATALDVRISLDPVLPISPS